MFPNSVCKENDIFKFKTVQSQLYLITLLLTFPFQTINVTSAATGYGLGLACDTLVSQVRKTVLCNHLSNNSFVIETKLLVLILCAKYALY